MVYLLSFFSYLSGSKSVSARPSDQDTIRNTPIEASASSGGKTINLKEDCSQTVLIDELQRAKYANDVGFAP